MTALGIAAMGLAVIALSISPDRIRAIRWSGSRIFSGSGACTARPVTGPGFDSGLPPAEVQPRA